MNGPRRKAQGFTVLELMMAMAIFVLICGAMFGLLQLSQQKYNSESQMSGSFQEARLGVDQILRDVNISGYPSLGMFSKPISTAAYAVGPFAWDPGYPNLPPCSVGSTCNPTPGPFDLIVETDLGNGNGVSWIRYQLVDTTLYRGVVQKTLGADPVSATPTTSMTPFVLNVMNNVTGSLQAQIAAQYPNQFPAWPVSVFQYTCSTPSGPQPCTSAAAAGYNGVNNISDVDVTLLVKTPQVDMQTQSLQLMELTGRGHRSNPTY